MTKAVRRDLFPVPVTVIHPLARDIEKFLAETGMTPTFFGYEVMRDPAFVFEVRHGRDLRGTTETKVRFQMAHYRRWRQFMHPSDATAAVLARR